MLSTQHLTCRTTFQTLPKLQMPARKCKFATAQLAVSLPAPVIKAYEKVSSMKSLDGTCRATMPECIA